MEAADNQHPSSSMSLHENQSHIRGLLWWLTIEKARNSFGDLV